MKYKRKPSNYDFEVAEVCCEVGGWLLDTSHLKDEQLIFEVLYRHFESKWVSFNFCPACGSKAEE